MRLLARKDRKFVPNPFSLHPEIDWKGAMGFRDVIAHRYFDIDAEQIWWICTHEVGRLSEAVRRMIDEFGA